MSDDAAASGGEYRALLLRILDKIEADVARLDGNQMETDRYARSSFSRVEAVEDSVAQLREALTKVTEQADESTLSITEIKAVAKVTGKAAGYISGAVTGTLGAVVIAFLLKLLHIN